MTPPPDQVRRADLVLEGGGVKGVALAGAVVELARNGYAFPRVAGSSAGAVAGCLVAALQAAGEPVARLEDVLRAVDLRRFRDVSGIGRLPLVGRGLALLAHDGLYDGRYLERFLTGALGELGVRTFGDLRLPDPGTSLSPAQSSRLVVTASDLSRRRLARLPWDLPSYGVDPDDYPVARAVRASSAIPFFFRPVVQPTPDGDATWVDGGLLSNFPVDLFDRTDGAPPRWPTFGVRLTARPGTPPATHPVHGPFGIGLAALDTLLTDQDAAHVEDPCTVVRTVFVPTDGVSAVDFGLDDAAQDALSAAGTAAARSFLAGWDWPSYLRQCRGGTPLPVASSRVAPDQPGLW
ncbi:MAG: patatin-like phospholipase family protein [Frankiales bacterium]|nr:patatin-like phospholipase family protein [Frankiales bacterium]